MAQIPGAQGLGEAVARPADLSQVRNGADAFGAGLFRAVEGVGADVQRQEVQAQREADAMRREADALAREEARQAMLERRAADKAQALGVMQSTADALQLDADELSAGVLGGQVDKTKADAEWSAKARERVAAALEGVPADHKAAVERDLAHRVHTLGRSAVTKAVRQRDRDDARSGVQQTMEYAQRLYATNPAAAELLMSQTLDGIGPAAGLGADDISKAKQGWREQTQFTTAWEAVSAGRDNRKALDKAESLIAKLPALDPMKRAQLTDRVAGYRLALDQRAEMAAQRAARESERVLARAGAEFQTFQALADKGGILAPEYIDRVLQATAGTPYQGGVKALAQQARETGGLAAQPVPAQVAALDQVNALIAQRGRTPELEKRREQIEKVVRGSQQDMQNDPLRAGLERGVITDLVPLDLKGGLPGLVSQLQARIPQAERVGRWAGQAVSPLLADEAIQVKQLLDALPAKERAGSVLLLGKALGPQASAGLAAQIERQTKGAGLPERAFGYALAMQDGMTTAGRLRSELVLKGAEAMRSGASTKVENPRFGAPPSRWGGILAGRLEGFPNEAMRTQIVEAATLIAHGLAAESGGEIQIADLDRALRLAVGGELVPRGAEVMRDGKKQPALIPLPAERTEADLDKTLRAVTPDMLGGKTVTAGGQEVLSDVFVRDVLPGAALAPVSPGVYAPLVGGRTVRRADGSRLLIQVR